jgi:hypothetical protein
VQLNEGIKSGIDEHLDGRKRKTTAEIKLDTERLFKQKQRQALH